MSDGAIAETATLEQRARQSKGASADPIYKMVARSLASRNIRGDIFADIGCGGGRLWNYVSDHFINYIGVDAVRYEQFPSNGEFHKCNLDDETIPLNDSSVDVVAAAETIEHLENPRGFFRELVRICKPGGWVIITTPNQLSLLSKLTLLLKNRFNAFQDDMYPAHITALLECDLIRMARENNLANVETEYSHSGRIPFWSRHYPAGLCSRMPRLLSDNFGVIGRK